MAPGAAASAAFAASRGAAATHRDATPRDATSLALLSLADDGNKSHLLGRGADGQDAGNIFVVRGYYLAHQEFTNPVSAFLWHTYSRTESTGGGIIAGTLPYLGI
jgi:hypothetical protein